MSTRPAELFPLFAGLESLPGIGPKLAARLATAGISRPRDLLFTLPARGIAWTRVETIRGLDLPATVTVAVTVRRHLPPSAPGGRHVVVVEDAATSFELVYFRGAAHVRRLLPVGGRRVVSGTVEFFNALAQMVHPSHVADPTDAADMPGFEPVYPLATIVPSRTLARAAQAALERAPEPDEWIDAALRAREDWPDWRTALARAHAPACPADIAPDSPARRRLAYDEFFAYQVSFALARSRRRARPGRTSCGTGDLSGKVLASLPFTPTGAQRRALAEIASDMGAPVRMMRLLQGDVGAGKTLVAMLAMLGAVEAGGQAVLMAPTEILARQHLDTLRPLAEAAGVDLALLTGRDQGAERAARLDALASGALPLLVGTHAVFQADVVFADLRLAVIDEQHRFGVAQRMRLGAKGDGVDVLVMTATPIPRSLSLAQHGDLDLSVLDEKPPGRRPVRTALVSVGRYEEVVDHLAVAIAEGQQAYWVCPLVDESAVSDLAAAEHRCAALRARLGAGQVGLVHGQMAAAERDAAMARFVSGEAPLLVATTVIEVGVNVPAASIMVVERAEAFGLSQLHQLRGRVGRGAAQSTCVLMYRPPLGESARRRLEVMRETEDGFRIAEEDLALRGAGDAIGTAQSGLPRFRIADLERQQGLMELAHRDARRLLDEDPTLETARGRAVRLLLWLTEQERGIHLIDVG